MFVFNNIYISRYCNFADVDECASNPCFHESACIPKTNGYECECKPGYTGTSCESGKARQPLEIRQFLALLHVSILF